MHGSYLADLTWRLAAGAARLEEPCRQRHGRFLAGQQNSDGGFAGRQGPSDLYYTGFAVRALALLGLLDSAQATGVVRFLLGYLGPGGDAREPGAEAGGTGGDRAKVSALGRLPSVDFYSLVFTAVLLEASLGWEVFQRAGLDRVAVVVERVGRLRRADGGLAKTERSPHSSTYHTFLGAACCQLTGAPLPASDQLVQAIRSRQRPDGGFVELEPLPRSGTNPTAAAIGLMRMLGASDQIAADRAASFLASMQTREGGFRAHEAIPVADLLSTFTALTALVDLEATAAIDLKALMRYVESLERAEGGFLGGLWDDQSDAEYTFYGLGSLALAHGLDHQRAGH
ncbi:MAG TPA: beta-hydroxylase [Planctomycetaceae bacterium]|nr:beta-hydroxylase [Planctomycetaceae bacterium]HIQ22679.1 beta-hydroxylase [Planctomycetota bacterium]